MSQSAQTRALITASHRVELVSAQESLSMERSISYTRNRLLTEIAQMPARIKHQGQSVMDTFVETIERFRSEHQKASATMLEEHLRFQDARMRYMLASNLARKGHPKDANKVHEDMIQSAADMLESIDARSTASLAASRLNAEIRSVLSEVWGAIQDVYAADAQNNEAKKTTPVRPSVVTPRSSRSTSTVAKAVPKQ